MNKNKIRGAVIPGRAGRKPRSHCDQGEAA